MMWPTGGTMTVDLPNVTIRGKKVDNRILLDSSDLQLYLTKCAETLDDAGASKDIGKTIRVIRDSLNKWQEVN